MPHYTKQQVKNEYNKAFDFVNKYVHSQGFAQRYAKYHPLGDIRTFLQGKLRKPSLRISYNKGSNYNVNTTDITINPKEDYTLDRYSNSLYDLYNKYGITDLPNGSVMGHELGHYINRVVSNKNNFDTAPFYSLRVLFRNYSPLHSDNYPQLTPNKKVNEHDSRRSENYSDLIDFRRMLYNDKIYDSTKANNPFTKAHLKKAKEKYKDQFIRLFNSFTDDRIINIMNTVAQNNNQNNKQRYSLEDIYYG